MDLVLNPMLADVQSSRTQSMQKLSMTFNLAFMKQLLAYRGAWTGRACQPLGSAPRVAGAETGGSYTQDSTAVVILFFPQKAPPIVL